MTVYSCFVLERSRVKVSTGIKVIYMILVVFLSLSRIMPGCYLKFGYEQNLPYISHFIIRFTHPDIWDVVYLTQILTHRPFQAFMLFTFLGRGSITTVVSGDVRQ
jgi:hypothetical protein